jgi:ureidoglycolate amidohydrolase
MVRRLMRDEAGLVVREDSVGNIYGTWPGSGGGGGTWGGGGGGDGGSAGDGQRLGAVLTGSHCDAIPLAGAYDGTLGVVGAIEALAALRRAGFRPLRPLAVVMFTSEEPTRFGLSCSGSRAMAGALDLKVLTALRDANGTGYLEAARGAGYGAASAEAMLAGARVEEGAVDYFLELHIEQGPELEREGLDVGVVTAIAAPAALEVAFRGPGGHAGALLMPGRHDAGLAGAELALSVERRVLSTGSPDTVGTTGRFEVSPGAVNSVPRAATLGIDIRDTDGARRDAVVAAVLDDARELAARRGVGVDARVANQDPPAACADDVQAAVQASADALGYSSKRMVSRAYHDALFMARVAPTGMVFVPCREGWSHRPDESASEGAIGKGVRVLALAMAELAGGKFGAATTGDEASKDEL